jgi:dienelactone hydrolase
MKTPWLALLFLGACTPPVPAPLAPAPGVDAGAPDGSPAPVPPTTPPSGNPADLQALFPGSKLFIPSGAPARTAAVVMLHGSEGGTDGAIWADAQALAEGAAVVTLALCWFGCPGTPDRIVNLPLERVRDAALWLKTLPMVGGAKVGLFGWSRGAEQSVLLASVLASQTDFAAVAVHAASDTIVCAYDPKTEEVISESGGYAAAWTWNGMPLYGERTEPYGSGPRIAIEKYPGPVWISHGTRDELWEVERSQKLAAARQQAGLPTETHYWQGEGHVLMQAKNRAAFASSLAGFMTRELK